MIKVSTPNGPIIFEQSVLSWIKEYTITGLNQCQDYEVEILAHCSAGIYKTESEMQANEKKLKFLTPPEKVRNFKLENSTSNSLTIKWDATSAVNPSNLKVGPFGFLPAVLTKHQMADKFSLPFHLGKKRVSLASSLF